MLRKIGLASKNKKCGFTLVEVLMVVTILAMLSTIALPKFIEVRHRAKEENLRYYLKILNKASETYHADMGVYPADIEDLYASSCPGEGLDRIGDEVPTDPTRFHGPYLASPPPCPFTGANSDYAVTHVWSIDDNPPYVGRVRTTYRDVGSNGIMYCDW